MRGFNLLKWRHKRDWFEVLTLVLQKWRRLFLLLLLALLIVNGVFIFKHYNLSRLVTELKIELKKVNIRYAVIIKEQQSLQQRVARLLSLGAAGDVRKKQSDLLEQNGVVIKRSGNLISLDCNDVALSKVVKSLVELSKKNIVLGAKIHGNVTVHLHQVSWDKALDSVLRTSGLAMQKSGEVVYVAPIKELNKMAASQKYSLKSRVFKIHYAKAENVIKSLLTSHGVMSSLGSISFDKRTNSLWVQDGAKELARVGQYLQAVDVPVKQITIDAQIVYVDDEVARELGLRFLTNKSVSNAYNDSSRTIGSSFSNNFGHFSLALAKLENSTLLDAELTALENEGKAQIVSHPKLVTSNLQAAYIESGEEVPYQEKTANGETSATFKKAVLSLKVTPQLTAHNKINLSLQLNQDKVGAITVNGVPTIQTRKINTNVLVANGDTVVLGGIYETTKNRVSEQVPFLSAIPVFGAIFKHHKTVRERRELLIFVTPDVRQ